MNDPDYYTQFTDLEDLGVTDHQVDQIGADIE